MDTTIFELQRRSVKRETGNCSCRLFETEQAGTRRKGATGAQYNQLDRVAVEFKASGSRLVDADGALIRRHRPAGPVGMRVSACLKYLVTLRGSFLITLTGR